MLRATFGFAGVGPMVEDGVRQRDWKTTRLRLGTPTRVPAGLRPAPGGESGRDANARAALAAGVSPAADQDDRAQRRRPQDSRQGELPQAQQLAEEAARIVNGRGLNRRPPSSFILTALGTVHSRQGRLEEARAEFEYAIYRRRRWVLLTPWVSVEIQLRLAQVLLAMDDRPAAATVLAEVKERADGAA